MSLFCPKCGAHVGLRGGRREPAAYDLEGRRWFQFAPLLARCPGCGASLRLHPVARRIATACLVYGFAALLLARPVLRGMLGLSAGETSLVLLAHAVAIAAAIFWAVRRYGHVQQHDR